MERFCFIVDIATMFLAAIFFDANEINCGQSVNVTWPATVINRVLSIHELPQQVRDQSRILIYPELVETNGRYK